MNHRQMSDGSIVFPKRGKPPMIVPGFYQDGGDPYLWHPDFIDCVYRCKKDLVLPCGRLSMNWYCELFQKIITPKTCEECDSCKPET